MTNRNHYIQNKDAYIYLKGGVIDRKLKISNVITKLNLPELEDVEYCTIIRQWSRISQYNTDYYVWSYDISSSLFPKYNEEKDVTKHLYYDRRQYTKAYRVDANKIDSDILRDIVEQKFGPSCAKIDSPYKYTPTINLFGVDVSIFNNFFNARFYKDIIDPMMMSWMDSVIGTSLEMLMAEHKIIIKMNMTSQPAIFNLAKFSSRPNSGIFKIHLTVRDKYIFWTVHKLILNLGKFLDEKGILRILKFKIIMNVVNFNYAEEYVDEYPSDLYLKGYNVAENGLTYTYNENEYIRESIFEANIVIYPLIFDEVIGEENIEKNRETRERNRANIRETIKILVELFPDSLQDVGSKKYPRFNFRVNNIVYCAFGNGDDKENIADDIYTQPTEYKKVKCNTTNDGNTCLMNNANSKILSNTELCTYSKDGICKEKNILSKYKLVYKKTPSALVIDDKQLDSITNIYEYIGQKIPDGVKY